MSSVQLGALSNDTTTIEPFKVYIRIRPLNEKEKLAAMNPPPTTLKPNFNKHNIPKDKNILVAEDNLLFVLDPDSLDYNGRREKTFVFDNIFTERHSNYDLFEASIKGIIDNVMKGYNSTALAYGVTGTGKTHTVFGNVNMLVDEVYKKENYVDNIELINSAYVEKGVCVYALDYLFEQIMASETKSFTVKISYLEIYNEQVIDLLVPKSNTLMIVEDSNKGVIVPDLSE